MVGLLKQGVVGPGMVAANWLGHQCDQFSDGRSCASLRPRHTVHPVHKIQKFKQDMGGTIAIRCFELVAHCSVAGHRQAFGGYCRPGDVAAKTFQLISFMGPGGNAGME